MTHVALGDQHDSGARQTRPATSWRRHPAVLVVRRALRNGLARVRRLWTRNPPLPAAVGSVLFVCKGNICRSPFAAYHAALVAREMGLAPAVRSAGLKPSQANACPDAAIAAALAYGHDMRPWRPLPLTDDLMADHDLIVVMETGQLAAVRRRWPQHHRKVVLLSLFGPPPADGWSRLNIEDPFGREQPAFDACYARIDAAVRDLFTRLPRPARP